MADTAVLPQAGMALPAPAGNPGAGLVAGWRNLSSRNKIAAMVGVAASLAILVAAWMWSQQPDYKILFSNIPDKDGGAIIASLTQLNVPYKVAEGGGAIMIPANLVPEIRLKLASQGLPKGGTVGFELIDNQKFGATQFQEQVNYQRALEGELQRSIESLGAVQTARVHLAIPKPTLFMREQQKPTASVLVSLYNGKTLDRGQVAGIMHLVSSSIADLPVKNVSVVDQTGALLSPQTDGNPNQMDATQLTYVQQLEATHIKRIMDILGPLYGVQNIRAQVTADIDFSQSEQTSEAYKPNGNPAEAAVRSQQINESSTPNGSGAQGVPGALTNQPSPNATATLNNGQTNPNAAAGSTTSTAANNATRKESVTNYEVDKTVRRVSTPTGMLKRLSAAVVLNNKTIPPAKPGGKETTIPLTADELTQVNNLVKEAIGFTKERGDSINVVNALFTPPSVEKMPDVPLWKQTETISMAKEVGRYALFAAVLLFVVFGVIKPIMRQIAPPPAVEEEKDGADGEPVEPVLLSADGLALSNEEMKALPSPSMEALEKARALAKQDPRIVANVIRNWVNKE